MGLTEKLGLIEQSGLIERPIEQFKLLGLVEHLHLLEKIGLKRAAGTPAPPFLAFSVYLLPPPQPFFSFHPIKYDLLSLWSTMSSLICLL